MFQKCGFNNKEKSSKIAGVPLIGKKLSIWKTFSINKHSKKLVLVEHNIFVTYERHKRVLTSIELRQ